MTDIMERAHKLALSEFGDTADMLHEMAAEIGQLRKELAKIRGQLYGAEQILKQVKAELNQGVDHETRQADHADGAKP